LSILIGNGVSMNIWKQFDYRLLLDTAFSDKIGDARLQPIDRGLFDLFGSNFEQVMSSLLHARRALVQLHLDGAAAEVDSAYLRIRMALTRSIHAVHPEWETLVDAPGILDRIADELQRYKRIYTTNYDVVIYWAILRRNAREDQDIFKDAFFSRTQNGTVTFNIADAQTTQSASLVLYPHGALHLLREIDGKTHKICYTEFGRILERFGAEVVADSVPLLVTEGDSVSKMASINQTGYLSFCREAMGNDQNPLVVLGHSLSEADRHLADAIADRAPFRPRTIAIGIYPPAGNPAEQMAHFRAVLQRPSITLAFFDSTTHPLASGDLQLIV
jgi:hypothetical protein